MTPKNLEDLYIHELRDVYSAESQLVDALPEMVKLSKDHRLQKAFEHHLEQTKEHKRRLEKIFERHDMSPSGETCHAMKGLIKEANSFASDAKSFLGSDAPPPVVDAGLISHAQRVEHYEISAYGTVCTYAETLGHNEDYRLLTQTLDEEKSTDGELNELAKGLINPKAASASA